MSECGHEQTKLVMDQYNSTELIVRDDIMAKALELAALISTSSEVEFYQKSEKQINTNEHVQGLINIIKKKQKEIVAFESFRNQKMVDKIEAEIVLLQEELDQIPIVSEFQQSQSDINYLLQLVMGVVRDTVAQKIEVEAGTVDEDEKLDTAVIDGFGV
ncbi:RicAFT regulatory complex protein RicA family protein [Paenibacillus psychroresistens]|nr:YlbF family regulator [Paenibacillus psychroresistens]